MFEKTNEQFLTLSLPQQTSYSPDCRHQLDNTVPNSDIVESIVINDGYGDGDYSEIAADFE